MLRMLPRISAPEGFDESVRLRIAEKSAGSAKGLSTSAWPLVIKFGFPAATLALIAIYLFLPQMPDRMAVLPIADQIGGRVAETRRIEAGSDLMSGNKSVREANLPLELTRAVNRRSSNVSGNSTSRDAAPGGGSLDSAISQPDPPLMPPGLDGAPKALKTDTPAGAGNSIRTGEILTMLGISANCGPQSCDVRSVAAGSFAAGAGVLAGDKIVEIDSAPIAPDFSAKGAVTVKSLTILRDGRKISLALRLPE